jgi:hypothetical protein
MIKIVARKQDFVPLQCRGTENTEDAEFFYIIFSLRSLCPLRLCVEVVKIFSRREDFDCLHYG